MYADDLLAPRWEQTRRLLPPVTLFAAQRPRHRDGNAVRRRARLLLPDRPAPRPRRGDPALPRPRRARDQAASARRAVRDARRRGPRDRRDRRGIPPADPHPCLAWIWRDIAAYPNVFFDTAWWSAADQLALFALIPPGQILYATDIPFGTPQQTVVGTFRSALQAGLSTEQLESVACGQLERIVAAFATSLAGGSALEFLDLARLACLVGDDAPQAAHCAAIVELIELALALPPGDTLPERVAHIHLIVTASVIAATPDVPVAA